MLLQLQLAHKRLTASLLHPVPVGNILHPKCIQLAADESDPLVGSSEVHITIRHPRESLITSLPGAVHRLPLLKSRPRMVLVDMALQVCLACTPDIAEHAVNVFLLHVSL